MTEVVPEPTPNPNAVKFTLDRPATEGRSQTFRAGSDPAESPLGARIFALDGVTNVFMTANFVSVTKEDAADWDELVPRVIDELQAHFAEAG
jgi:Scaffold protein Nfu/NifU N terminal